MYDFKTTFWETYNLPIYFGIHFVKLVSSDINSPSESSPNCFHQDGEPFTFGHLIYRSSNTKGGKNYIALTPARNKNLEYVQEAEILESFYLENPLESFAVHDSAVTHYVEPIVKHKRNKLDAERYIVLIDFSPMKQVI